MNPDNDYVEVFHAKDGWRWHRKDAANHEIVSTSGESYDSHTRALEVATALNEGLPIIDIDANKEH